MLPEVVDSVVVAIFAVEERSGVRTSAVMGPPEWAAVPRMRLQRAQARQFENHEPLLVPTAKMRP
jgi:hypothetical protein